MEDQKDVLIKNQSELIDKLLDKEDKNKKNTLIKDCVLYCVVGLVTIVFFIGFFMSSYDTSNYSNNTITDSEKVMNIDERNDK